MTPGHSGLWGRQIDIYGTMQFQDNAFLILCPLTVRREAGQHAGSTHLWPAQPVASDAGEAPVYLAQLAPKAALGPAHAPLG